MATTWVLVANSSQAKIYSAHTATDQLGELAVFNHPESRLHVQELTTDLPGRSFDSAGQGRHAMEQMTNPKEQEAIEFVKEIGEYLTQAERGNRFDRLVLTAAPAFLGLLRTHLSEATRKRITMEIDKDLVTQDVATVRRQLPERL